MITCPACGATVNADFGMVACSKCDTVFMVEIDGTVTLPSAEDAGNVEFTEADDAAPTEDAPTGEALFEEASVEPPAYEEPIPEEPPMSEESPESATGYGSPMDEPMEALPADESSTEPAPETTEYSEDFLNNMNDTHLGAEAADTKNDPLGVSRFDASEASQLADGPYYYDLRVSGIDTATLKQQVIDALADKRLNWNPDEIKKQIKMGQLVLANLNPVRAVLAVLRLQSLDVDVEWDQKPFTAEAAPPKDQET